jgi:hypothetical protein
MKKFFNSQLIVFLFSSFIIIIIVIIILFCWFHHRKAQVNKLTRLYRRYIRLYFPNEYNLLLLKT